MRYIGSFVSRTWKTYRRKKGFSSPFTMVLLALLIIALPLTIYIVRQQVQEYSHASGATVIVSNTTTGTMQAQLSTNIVTWAADLTQFPNGQSNFNALHAPLVRLHVGDDGGPAMPEINQGSWDMTTINTMVNDVFATGQQPLMNIKFAPDWMWTCYPNSIGASANQTQGTGTVKDQTFQTFAQYMARLASYYNKGSLTEENGTVLINPVGTTHKITYWELWNEPDLSNETPCSPSSGVALTPAQYLTMWNAVTAAMLQVDPTIKFVGPADAGGQFASGATTDSYVDNIMGSSTTVKPAAISFHAYGYWAQVPDKYYFDGDGTQGGGGIAFIVQSAQSIHTKYPATPIWLTEVNVNSDWSAQGQNDDEMAPAWRGSLIQQLAPYGIGLINQFDFSGANLFGLVDGEGVCTGSTCKPATGNTMLPYYMVQAFDKAFPAGSTILNSTSAQNGIQSLAIQKPDGTVSVMVVNRELSSNTVQSKCGTGGVAATVTVDLSALNPSAITLTQIDKNNINCSTWFGIAPTTTTLSTSQPVTLTFPGFGIAILNVATNGQAIPTSTPAPLPSPTPTPIPGSQPSSTPVPTSTAPAYKISGIVYVDSNQNGVKDSGELGYTAGAQVILSGSASQTVTTNATGNYIFNNLSNGTYIVKITVPAGYKATNANPKTKNINGANATANFGIAPLSVSTPTPIPTLGSIATPTVATTGTNLLFYDHAVSSNFTDNSFSYSSRNTCDTSTFISAPCSYAIAYQSYGAIELHSKIGALVSSNYKSLDYNINTAGQSLSSFGVIISTTSGGWINEFPLSSSFVTQNFGNGWVHISIPMATLDPKGISIGMLSLENITNSAKSLIHIDDVYFLGK